MACQRTLYMPYLATATYPRNLTWHRPSVTLTETASNPPGACPVPVDAVSPHQGFTFAKRRRTRRWVSQASRAARKAKKNHDFVPSWDENWLRCGLRSLARSTVARCPETTALCARENRPGQFPIQMYGRYWYNSRYNEKEDFTCLVSRFHVKRKLSPSWKFNLLRWKDVPRTSRIFCPKTAIFSQF